MVTVVLAVVQHADRILLIQESKERIRGTWNLPGGRVERGESLIDALTREVREESGLEVTPRGLLYVDQFVSGHADVASRLRFVFVAAPLTDALKSEADEHSLRAQWFSRSELPSLTVRNSTVNRMIELAANSHDSRQTRSPRSTRPCLPTSQTDGGRLRT